MDYGLWIMKEEKNEIFIFFKNFPFRNRKMKFLTKIFSALKAIIARSDKKNFLFCRAQALLSAWPRHRGDFPRCSPPCSRDALFPRLRGALLLGALADMAASILLARAAQSIARAAQSISGRLQILTFP